MSLKDRITEDMKTAMRAKDAPRLLTIRGLLAALKQREVDERIVARRRGGRRDRRQARQAAQGLDRSSSRAGGRQDLVDKESAELEVLEGYLPQRLGADEIAAEVAALVAETRRSGPGRHGQGDGARRRRALPAAPRWRWSPPPSRRRSRADASNRERDDLCPSSASTADVCVAPQLDPAAMAEAAAAGFRSVINNRPDFEGGPTQPTSASIEAAARAAGLEYACLPVAPNVQSAEEIARFAELLDDAAEADPRVLPLRARARASSVQRRHGALSAPRRLGAARRARPSANTNRAPGSQS